MKALEPARFAGGGKLLEKDVAAAASPASRAWVTARQMRPARRGSRRRRGGRRGSRRWPCCFASAAAVALPASVSMSARMAQVFHGADAWPNCALHSIARRISCRASSRRRSLRRAMARLLLAQAFVRHVADLDILVCRLPEEGHGFLRFGPGHRHTRSPVDERARLPGDISEPHLDRERFPVGILRRFRLARLLIGHAGLMPAHGDGCPVRPVREPPRASAYAASASP